MTDQTIRAAKAEGKRLGITDQACIGLVLRVTVSGIKTSAFRYRLSDVHRVTVGRYPNVSLARARDRRRHA